MADQLPLIVKPKEARRLLSCGQERLYELINSKELESFLDGGSRKITMASIQAYIERKLVAAASS